MSNSIFKQLEKIINTELENNIVPVKIGDRIIVGDVEIISNGTCKILKQKGRIKFTNIFLNITAVALANMLALRKSANKINTIYEADQNYGRYFVDCQMLRLRYNQAVKEDDVNRSAILWSRYTERCDRVHCAKLKVEELIDF